MRRAGALLIVLAACSSCGEGAALESPAGGVPVIRVLLEAASASASARLTAAGPYRIEDPKTGRVVEEGTRLDRTIALAGASLRAPLRVISRAAPLAVDGTSYPGDLLLVPGAAGARLVNETSLEEYLPGVLAGEMSAGFPPASLSAQAVAARTYALDRLRREPAATHHVYDSTRSQRYLGLVEPGGGPLTRAAADTRGIVLQWAGHLVPAYYHSTCGDRTAAATDVLDGEDLPPLSGGPCGFCSGSPRHRWTARFPLAEVGPALGLPAAPVAVSVTGRTPDGRAKSIRFESRLPVSRSAADVRIRLGPGRLPSTAIGSVDVEGPDLVFRGAGFGHGAGMCQYGARGMAQSGLGPADILMQYYPAARLSRIY